MAKTSDWHSSACACRRLALNASGDSEDGESVGFKDVAGLIFGELAVAAAQLQVVNEFLAKLPAILFVARHGAKDFEHFLGQLDFPLAALLSVNQEA
jgi:hypothetical protein